jgi:hypothetical protein
MNAGNLTIIDIEPHAYFSYCCFHFKTRNLVLGGKFLENV